MLAKRGVNERLRIFTTQTRGPRKVPQRSEDTLWGIRSDRATDEPTAATRRKATSIARIATRLSGPSHRLPSFRFGHLRTCLICSLFGHFKHVPKCPKLQYKLLSFASYAFLYELCLHFCHFCLKPYYLLAIPSLFFFFACYIFADL